MAKECRSASGVAHHESYGQPGVAEQPVSVPDGASGSVGQPAVILEHDFEYR